MYEESPNPKCKIPVNPWVIWPNGFNFVLKKKKKMENIVLLIKEGLALSDWKRDQNEIPKPRGITKYQQITSSVAYEWSGFYRLRESYISFELHKTVQGNKERKEARIGDWLL